MIKRNDESYSEREINHYLDNFDALRYTQIKNDVLEKLFLVTDLVFLSKDGQDFLLISTKAGFLHLFNAETGDPVSEINIGKGIFKISISKDLRFFILMSTNNQLTSYSYVSSLKENSIQKRFLTDFKSSYSLSICFNSIFALNDKGLYIYCFEPWQSSLTIEDTSLSAFDVIEVILNKTEL